MSLLSLLAAHRRGLSVQQKSRADLEALQGRRFRALVRHCAAFSPWYRAVMTRYRIDPERCRVQDFPVLDRATALANFDRIATDPAVSLPRIRFFAEGGAGEQGLMDGRYRVITNHGSSGEAGYAVFSRREWAEGTAPLLRAGTGRGRDRRLAWYGPADGSTLAMAMSGGWGLPRLACHARSFDAARPVEETAAAIAAFGPDILAGTSAAILTLAAAQRSGARIVPGSVRIGGESLPPDRRRVIEEAFAVPLVSLYGSCEHLIMGMSRGGEDTVLFEENFVFEVDDGQSLVTNLYNRTFPLIRYRLDDRLVPGEAAGSEPLPYRRVRRVADSAGPEADFGASPVNPQPLAA